MIIYNPEEFNWHTFTRRPDNRNLTLEQMRQKFMMEQSYILQAFQPPSGGVKFQPVELTLAVELLTELNEILLTEDGQDRLIE